MSASSVVLIGYKFLHYKKHILHYFARTKQMTDNLNLTFSKRPLCMSYEYDV